MRDGHALDNEQLVNLAFAYEVINCLYNPDRAKPTTNGWCHIKNIKESFVVTVTKFVLF